MPYVWTDSEDLGNVASGDDLKWLFKHTDKQFLVSKEEQLLLRNLPEVVTVYRGVTRIHEDGERDRSSWTLDKKVTRNFALRWARNVGEGGHIYRGEINRDEILAYFDSRDEQEVICQPENIRLVIN